MKKAIAILLVLMMLCASALAMNSKTSTDIAEVIEVVDENNNPVDVTVEIVESETVNEEISKIIDHVNNPADPKPAVTYFPEEVQNRIKEGLPEGANADDLDLDEVVALDLSAGNIQIEGIDRVSVTFKLDTKYTYPQKIFPVLGIYDENKNVAWENVTGEVLENGDVKVYFTAEQLNKMLHAPDVAIAFLSAPLETPAA